MSTPTIRMLERQMTFKRQQDEANRPPPTPDDLFWFARRRLRFDNAAARRFAGLEERSAFTPPAVESPPDWRAIAVGLMMNIEGLMYERQQRRPAPQAVEDDAGVPAPTSVPAAPAMPAPAPTPASSKKQPVEAVIHRDLDGRLLHADLDDGQRIHFQRDIDGKIISAASERHLIQYQRDETGRIAGARLEPKGPTNEPI